MAAISTVRIVRLNGISNVLPNERYAWNVTIREAELTG